MPWRCRVPTLGRQGASFHALEICERPCAAPMVSAVDLARAYHHSVCWTRLGGTPLRATKGLGRTRFTKLFSFCVSHLSPEMRITGCTQRHAVHANNQEEKA